MKNRHRVSQVVSKAYLLTALWLSITDVYVGTTYRGQRGEAAGAIAQGEPLMIVASA